jgi:hypothetical protein
VDRTQSTSPPSTTKIVIAKKTTKRIFVAKNVVKSIQKIIKPVSVAFPSTRGETGCLREGAKSADAMGATIRNIPMMKVIVVIGVDRGKVLA